MGFARWAAAFVVVTVLAAGCTPTPAPSTTTPIATADFGATGPITWVAPPDPTGVLAADVAAWNQAHPNAPVEVEWLPASRDAWRDALDAAVTRDSGRPALVSVPSAWLPSFASNLEPLTASLEGVAPVASSSVTVDGKTYAVPIGLDATVLYYRTDLLPAMAGAGWTDIAAACTPLAGQVGCYGTGLGDRSGQAVEGLERLRAAGTEVLDADGKVALDPAKAAEGLTGLASAGSTGLLAQGSTGWTSEQALAAFREGRLAFVHGWASQAPWGSGSTAHAPGTYSVTTLPGAATVETLNLAVTAGSVDQGTALEFATWLAGADRQALRAEAGSLAPTLPALYERAAVRLNLPMEIAGQELATAGTWPRGAHADEIAQALADAVKAALGGTDPATAAADLRAKLDALR